MMILGVQDLEVEVDGLSARTGVGVAAREVSDILV
jgi:hypothetical protein